MTGGVIAPTLSELVTITCRECQGQGFHEGFSDLGVDHSRRCETCFGAGEIETCRGCGERPTIICGVEACACTYLTTTPAVCEICERTVSAAELDNANVCTRCRDEMAAKIQREADEHQAWVAEQLELGREYGWIQ